MLYIKIASKLPVLIPRALAGDPSAIALLAAAAISAAAYYIKENR